VRISAHVVLSGVKPREFEVAVRIGTRGVWIQTVGGLDRYTCIGDGLHPGDYLAPFYSAAQTMPERGRQLFLVIDWPEGQA